MTPFPPTATIYPMPQAPTPAVGSPLLTTKLFLPRLRPGMVARPQLVRMLDAAPSYPLTLVSAPAGFGKTTLVAAWAQQQPLPVGWLSLDAGDNDPNRFLAYLIAALQAADPSLGRDLRAALAGGQAPPIEAAAIMLINDLAQLPQDVLLVLDDFHVIEEPRIEEALATLVAHQPPQLHLLIATREDPPLPLARMRAQGQLVELRAQELRFSPARPPPSSTRAWAWRSRRSRQRTWTRGSKAGSQASSWQGCRCRRAATPAP